MKAGDKLARILLLVLLGSLIGALGTCGNFLPLGSRSELHAMPYVVPKFPGGTSLRMAMVHDILHERYLVHGEAWNREQARVAGSMVTGYTEAGDAVPPEEVLEAMDDLAVAEIHLHEEGAAAALMRRKLGLLPSPQASATRSARDTNVDDNDRYRRLLALAPLSPTEHQRYTAEANLGTALIHEAFGPALAGDADAQRMLAEGADHIEEAVRINPTAHFGREEWQALAVRHFLIGAKDPTWLTSYTVTGLALTQDIRGMRPAMLYGTTADIPDQDLSVEQRVDVRERITPTDIVPEWSARLRMTAARVPFDEPTLAIIGMWTLGGGPNAHFALALARLMEDVRQRAIAWDGYERAVELAGADGAGFSRDAAVARTLVAYCRARQAAIAQDESPDPVAWEQAALRRHQAELAWGQQYQREYQAYEAEQIAAGRAPQGVVDYSGFFRGRPSIASDPGQADMYVLTYTGAPRLVDVLPVMMLSAGACLWLDALDRRRRFRKGQPSRRCT